MIVVEVGVVAIYVDKSDTSLSLFIIVISGFVYVVFVSLPRTFIYILQPTDEGSVFLPDVLFYYIVQFTLDTVMFTFWFVCVGRDTTYGIPAAIMVWFGFFLGLMFMGLLMYLHKKEPSENKKKKVKVKK